MIAQTKAKDYWSQVTDVTCPGCKHGILRWAEAGYVPGWRECDTCGRQYQAGGDADRPTLRQRRGPTRRITPELLAAVGELRRQAAEHQLRHDLHAARLAAAEAMRGSYHGEGWIVVHDGFYSSGASGLSPTVRDAYWREWRRLAPPAAVSAWHALEPWLPRCVSVSALSTDGLAAVLYRRDNRSGNGGGTFRASVAGLLALRDRLAEAEYADVIEDALLAG